jgi:hypothetical protein
MKLKELLLELRENILHDRSDQTAGNPDALWSDDTLLRYINEAHRRFAREGLVIRDGTSSVAQVTLQDGVADYTLDPVVMAVISARLAGDPADLTRSGHAHLGSRATPDQSFFPPTSGTIPAGKPIVFTTDEYLAQSGGTGSATALTMRFHPVPDAAHDGATVNLRVVRMPLQELRIGQNETPEVPEEHHLEMLDWAAYLALRIADIELGAPQRALEFRRSFERHVREAQQATMRKLFAPVGWQFGKNGWSWEN